MLSYIKREKIMKLKIDDWDCFSVEFQLTVTELNYNDLLI